MDSLIILLGWPAVAASVVLLAVGIAKTRWQYFALATVTALPFLLYLAATPRFSFIASAAGVCCLAATFSASKRRTTLAAVLFLPFLLLASFLAIIVMRDLSAN